ncbi:MAG: Spy0128 family protein [Eubacteriaceae bacterium]|jgi:pilin isopeptide linkage protein
MTKTFSRGIRLTGLLFLAVLLIAMIFPLSANAADQAAGVSAVIPVQEKVTGDKPESTLDFKFKLTPVTENAPLPVNGDILTISGSGSGQFDLDLTGSKPGDKYEYTLTQQAVTADNYSSDTVSYSVMVYVLRHEDDQLYTQVVISNGDTKFDAAEFTNKYTAPVVPEPVKPTPESPFTGIMQNSDFQAVLIVLAVAAVSIVIARKKRSEA